MIKAELSYNPYLMEITASFNGHPPRINSLIEKYQSKPLQDWIYLIPQIFHDEMNGYGFELDFSGTELDCEEVCYAFRKANVSDEDVAVFMRNKLDSREQKLKDISSVLEWLEDNPNRKFDVQEFRAKNHDLFDENYTYITIHGDTSDTEIKDVSIENVNSVNELECTDLTHTPIIYYITNDVLSLLPMELTYLRSRMDICENQLFFCVINHNELNKIKRVIIDLGFSEPNMVSGVSDKIIYKYSMLYPVSDYINSSIKAFRAETDKISEVLSKENKKSELKGKEIHMRLNSIEGSIVRIKEADEKIQSRDILEYPEKFKILKDSSIGSIMNWRIKKTKITKPEEAYVAATEFDSFVKSEFHNFFMELRASTMEHANQIRNTYLNWYKAVMLDEKFSDSEKFLESSEPPVIPDQLMELMKIKEEKYVTQSSGPIGWLFKSSENDNQPVLETTFYYQQWREHMAKIITPFLETLVNERYEHLKEYSDTLAEIYRKHLSELLEKQMGAKEKVSSQLSADEKLLQTDNDWLTAFVDQLKNIERS
ncbi:hypothetical protein SAMN02910317_01407 [Ruminococcaceae bacterium FB2012]|nr:hypothetical protein SAMN02910317_01407 [Ruminococcaceae bacterium FB2012]